ncbi:MlaD family protein [Amycolatopsis umgeniensis]|uniref:Phospholipid/cholesterol/gamma-HCH transport system substrate-binding protein n=1 Tax=Amycolatopsis umgeniensis TaxID=336628 RepID=A0A841AW57_9PSEU|nr:MlaD family protein [Amycolatopsis umgeniensis]MBB5852096.1 phospholipid/cholesterol/gamma-HCH transport system substrate-binding protein [Amycolatopsis umgeniensis]
MRIRRGGGLPLVQLALFLVIGVGCSVYLGVTAVGPAEFRDATHVTVQMPDAGGLSPGASVTYHGVRAGDVDAVRLRTDGSGVDIAISFDGRLRVPADTRAVVAQDTAVALKHLDLRPAADKAPYLTDGATIHSEQTKTVLPLQTLLVNLMRLADSVDLGKVSSIADDLAIGFDGTSGHLRDILDDGGEIVAQLKAMRPTVDVLLTDAKDFLGEGTSARLPKVVSSLNRLTGELRGLVPKATPLLEQAPGLAEQLVPLLRVNQPQISALLANLVSPLEVTADRIPALRALFTAGPKGLGDLASSARNGYAAFTLVLAQGGICYYPVDRRTPTDTTPREPGLDFHCPGGQRGDSGVRGAANAPRPGTGTGAPAVPPPGAPDSSTGRTSWSSLYLQGAR